MIIYIACGDENGPGKVYQVTDTGRVLGIVNLPFTPTGLALHRQHGLIATTPRDGGKIVRIDDTGKVATIIEKDENLVHPLDVAVGGESDTIVVADNMADTLMATSTAGNKPREYMRFEGQKWREQMMSVAVTRDKHVLLGTDGDEGIYRFSGDSSPGSMKPILPGRGGVAADPATLKWAATQSPNKIHVFEGEEPVCTFTLPPEKFLYRQGLLSFSPAGGVVVAARDADKPDDNPWLILFETEEGKRERVTSLFQWDLDRMTDFVVGPRMYWERNERRPYRSLY